MKPVDYQVCYLWACPDCGTTWQARRRPRGGAQLVCAPLPEQRCVHTHRSSGFDGPHAYKGCGSVNGSSGRRGGIAPNVSI